MYRCYPKRSRTFGCCYQTVYNNSEVVSGFTMLSDLDLQVISNQALWDTCGVPLTTICTGEPFPGEETVDFGECTIIELSTFVAGLPETCVASTPLFLNPALATEDQLGEAVEELCQENCGGEIAMFLSETCRDPFTAMSIELSCLSTDGEIGDQCFFALAPGIRNTPFFADAEGTCFGEPSADITQSCPSGCQASLLEITNQLGCCYRSIYNDTDTLDLLFIDGQITFDDRAFFNLLGTQALWDACAVPLQMPCGALELAASTIMMVCVIILTFVI